MAKHMQKLRMSISLRKFVAVRVLKKVSSKAAPLVVLVFISGCNTTCLDWRCPLDVGSLTLYEAQLKKQDPQTLDFAEKEYRYRLVQWIGETRFAEAKQGNTISDYENFLTVYNELQPEAGHTLRVYAEIARSRVNGANLQDATSEPQFSKTSRTPQIRPATFPGASLEIASSLNEIVTDSGFLSTASGPESAQPGPAPAFTVPDGPLQQSITTFSENRAGLDASETDLKSLINASARQGDYGIAFDGIMNFAKRDDPHAQYLIGRFYEDGLGVDQDYQEAISWFEKATRQNQPEAKAALLVMYEVGLGRPTDPQQMYDWHLRAAQLGNAQAQTQVAIFYENGEGIAQDQQKAADWYRRAALQNNSNAQFLLGWMYAEGKGVKLDFVEACSWFLAAKTQGLAEAERVLQMILPEMTPRQISAARQLAGQRQTQISS